MLKTLFILSILTFIPLSKVYGFNISCQLSQKIRLELIKEVATHLSEIRKEKSKLYDQFLEGSINQHKFLTEHELLETERVIPSLELDYLASCND